MANDIGWRQDAVSAITVADDVVGEIEEPADQDFRNTPDRFRAELFARLRRLLYDKSALSADRDNDRVFDRLRLHQTENLGAKVFLRSDQRIPPRATLPARM